jgi:hypothetical protein
MKSTIDKIKERYSEKTLSEELREYMEKNYEPLVYYNKKNQPITNRKYTYDFTSGGSMFERGVKAITHKTIDHTFDVTDYVNFKFTRYGDIEFYLSDVLKLFGSIKNIVIVDLTCAVSMKDANSTFKNYENVHGNKYNFASRSPNVFSKE